MPRTAQNLSLRHARLIGFCYTTTISFRSGTIRGSGSRIGINSAVQKPRRGVRSDFFRPGGTMKHWRKNSRRRGIELAQSHHCRGTGTHACRHVGLLPNRGMAFPRLANLSIRTAFSHFDYANPDAPKGGRISHDRHRQAGSHSTALTNSSSKVIERRASNTCTTV